MPGAGKSTAGRHLAAALGWRFVDADVEIEQRIGMSIRAYFEREGEQAFRDLEQQVKLAQADLDQARGEREALERRVKLLYPQNLDPDMLDESARRLLNYGLPGEVVILGQPAERR